MSRPPYSITLLNDLHFHFPELLYRPTQFRTVPDILNYMVGVANHNPYEEMRNEYERHMGVSAPPSTRSSSIGRHHDEKAEFYREMYDNPPPRPVGMGSTSSSSYATHSSRPVGIGSSLPVTDSYYISPLSTEFVISSPPRARQSTTQQLISRFLNGLMGDPLQSPDIQSFLDQPVIVHPSDDQIREATSLYSAPQTYEDNCTICQDSIEQGQMIRTIDYCSHAFHQTCIDTWFTSHVSCPTCRHDIRNQ